MVLVAERWKKCAKYSSENSSNSFERMPPKSTRKRKAPSSQRWITTNDVQMSLETEELSSVLTPLSELGELGSEHV